MVYHTIEIEETDYQYLDRAAKAAGTTIQLFLKQLITKQQLTEQVKSQKTLTTE